MQPYTSSFGLFQWRMGIFLATLGLTSLVIPILTLVAGSHAEDLAESSSSVGYPEWDVNQDGIVDISDLLIVTRHLGETTDIPVKPNPDVNHDSKVDILDLVLVGSHYGEDYQGNIYQRYIYARVARLGARTIPQYGKFEARIETNILYNNPFSPEEVDLKVHFLTPAGRKHVMSAFYDEEDDQPVWKVRYAPMEVGRYRYYVMLGEIKKTAEQMFDCVLSDSDGFIHVSPDDYRYFQFDSGKPYFAIGHNVCWAYDDYEYYFQKMAAHGENYTRIWIAAFWDIALEWSSGNVMIEWLGISADYPGLGRYDLVNANRIDQLLELAEKYGIYIMLCLESFINLRTSEPAPSYQGSPYAKENGGMLEKPEHFFTHPEAIRLFKQRLRYLVARYAYHPNVLCWEFWNEVDGVENYISADVTTWHQDMARHLRRIDPMEHLISTSFTGTTGDPAIWQLPEMEYTQSHPYASLDMAASIHDWTQHNISEFGKPHIFGEYGISAGPGSGEVDPDGIHQHNGIWAAALSGSAGTPMNWWWEDYIDPYDLYYHFQPLAQFVEDVDWPRANFRDAAIGEIRYATPQFRDLELYCTADWGYQPMEPYRILCDGTIEGEVQIAKYLYAPWSPAHTPQMFLVDYPGDGSFEVHIDEVPSHGRLHIHLDGELVLDQELPTWPEESSRKESPLFWEKGENRISNSGFETDELGSVASGWTLIDRTDLGSKYRWEVDDEAHSGRRSLKVIGVQATGVSWHAIVADEDLSMEAGKQFTIAFWAKVDVSEGESRMVNTEVAMPHEPWTLYHGREIHLDSTDWKEYYDTFTATADVVEDLRVGLSVAQSDVDFWIDDFRFFEGEPMDEMVPEDLVYSIHVPAGEHIIEVDNQGEDWFSVNYYRLTNFHTREKMPALRVFGLQNDTEVILWLQNSEHTWYKMSMGMPLQTIPPVFVEVRGLQDGKYQVEWWDTYQPNSVESGEAVSTKGVLQLETPEITRDIACKVRLWAY